MAYRLEDNLRFSFHIGKFTAFTQELKNARILKSELNESIS